MMAELCLMASHGYPPGIVLSQEPGASRVMKPFLPGAGTRQDIIRLGSMTISPNQLKESVEPLNGRFAAKQCVQSDSAEKDPVILDLQGMHSDAVPLGTGIAKQFTLQREVFDISMSGLSYAEKAGLDMSPLSHLTGLQSVETDMHRLPIIPSLVYPNFQFSTQSALSDFMGDLVRNSKITIDSDGRVLIADSGAEMRDLLSIVAEFYLSRNLTRGRKLSMPVPYFSREMFDKPRIHIHGSSLKLEANAVAPVKSPEKSKLKQLSRKKNSRKVSRERDLFKRNYFHACESLLSILVDKKRQGKTAVLSLKKAGPELPELLNQFSAGIAGTGIAVLFSVICKVACGRVPFCASKMLSTGFGFGLVWLSWAVNRLRDTAIAIGKNPGKLSLNEDEMVKKVDKSVREIYFRAATLMAVAVLRFV
ncbi:uncharacterized protein LOC115728283 isoform X2 [Rhodamnia argentea]|uniref:Uncharacterized protein LOC115728283 isoform X2 n=1 Tax=Rhodamnia argentea TaxID=178133 RepID=A0ABM3HM81_9MYRT|nr:uncharacterized protein LOC115728283 isoform X2 [Rhodamnia argentea]